MRLQLLIISLFLISSCDKSTEPVDCAGVVGGNAEEDACDICNGNGSTCEADGQKNIYYKTSIPIVGFQFHVTGVEVRGVGDGAAGAAGFTVSTGNNNVLGFSLTAAKIAAGEGVLVVLDITGSGDACLEDVIISDSSGNSLDATVEDCTTIYVQ